MRPDKNKAFQLRKQGKSYREIKKILNISKSTISIWFRDVKWSKQIKDKLTKKNTASLSGRMKKMAKKAQEKRLLLYKEKREQAVKSYQKFKKDPLFIAGLMIYWGEGDSKLENGMIRVANSNPVMIRLFNQFLKKYFPEISQRAKVYLILYPDLDDNKCKKHWSRIVGIPLDKFFKSQYIKGHSPYRRLMYGIGNIIISSRANKEVIYTWLKIKQQEIKLARV